MTNRQLTYTNKYFLTAGQCNAQSRLPLQLLVERLIETATDHANVLGIGYDTLNPLGMAWVLSRVAVRMRRWPGVNTEFSLTTWIETSTRVYSNRCFVLTDVDGEVIGYARTVWAAIDVARRCAADLSFLQPERYEVTGRECQAEVMRRITLPDVTDVRAESLTFRFSDIDFNRHVNSVRYIDHFFDALGLEYFDSHTVDSFAINYMHESRCDETVTMSVARTPHGATFVLTAPDSNAVLVSAQLTHSVTPDIQ